MTAFREVQKVTDDWVMIHSGPFGTTCARVGCMPSKLFIQAANDFHRRHKWNELGLHGADQLSVDWPAVMKRVQTFRDRFVGGVLKTIDSISNKIIHGTAQFVEPQVLDVDGQRITADKIIIATGSSPIVPVPWLSFNDRILTTDEFFEQTEIIGPYAVVGTGVIGLELGQALSRLGIETHLFGDIPFIGGLTDPVVNDYALQTLKEELNLHLGHRAELSKSKNTIGVTAGPVSTEVHQVLAAMGRKPNLKPLNLQAAGVPLDERGLPKFNPHTMQVEGLPLFLAGDINGDRPILHEAADEGRIAGYNAVRDDVIRFQRRTRLGITFSDPNLAYAGQSFEQIKDTDHVVGEVRFDGQGRSLVMAKAKGILRVYVDKESGLLLGAEMVAPAGEHLAHLLSWAIQKKMTVHEALAMPFYHPVVEEGLRTALREASKQVKAPRPQLEVPECHKLPHEDCS
ncbi:MAG: dihydrolipoyl dehydrogenase [Pseudobdellovibrionaceae bacterium]|nr:MAG: dihydrolipoyl dehydrogenase [Pseudobdellovibrionaceae bacterium]